MGGPALPCINVMAALHQFPPDHLGRQVRTCHGRRPDAGEAFTAQDSGRGAAHQTCFSAHGPWADVRGTTTVCGASHLPAVPATSRASSHHGASNLPRALHAAMVHHGMKPDFVWALDTYIYIYIYVVRDCVLQRNECI